MGSAAGIIDPSTSANSDPRYDPAYRTGIILPCLQTKYPSDVTLLDLESNDRGLDIKKKDVII